MSACIHELMSGSGVCPKAISSPSGDHAKPETVKSEPSVSRLASAVPGMSGNSSNHR